MLIFEHRIPAFETSLKPLQSKGLSKAQAIQGKAHTEIEIWILLAFI